MKDEALDRALTHVSNDIEDAKNAAELKLALSLLQSVFRRAGMEGSEAEREVRRLRRTPTFLYIQGRLKRDQNSARKIIKFVRACGEIAPPVDRPPATAGVAGAVAPDALERHVWAIVTEGFFRSWPFKVAMIMLALAVSISGISAWKANVDAGQVATTLEEAKRLSREKVNELRTTADKTIAQVQERGRDALLDIERSVNEKQILEDVRRQVLKRFESHFDLAEEAEKLRVGLDKRMSDELDEAARKHPVTTENFDDLAGYAKYTISQIQEGVTTALKDSFQAESIRVDKRVESFADVASHQVEQIGSDASAAVRKAVEAAAPDNDGSGEPFDALATHFAEKITTAAGYAISELERREKEANREIGRVPDVVHHVSGEADALSGRLDGLAARASSVETELDGLRILSGSLSRINAHLDDEFLASKPVYIATVLGTTATYVFIVLMVAILALGMSGIAVYRARGGATP